MFDLLIDLIFPRYCYYCNKEGSYLCKDCITSYLNINWDQRCYICGKVCSTGFMHIECKEQGYLDGLIYFTVYGKKIREIIKDVKYKFHYDVLNELGEIMAEYLKIYKFSDDLILIDVPLHKHKMKYRGFNQSEVLAKIISSKTNYRFENLLSRGEDTITQVGLNQEERWNNLREVFKVNSEHIPEKVMIIDDVFTTGTTLNQCAKVLKENGSKEVYGFVFAKSRL